MRTSSNCKVCITHVSSILATYREVKRDITNVTACMCVGSACCSVSERGGVSGSSAVSMLFICSLFRILMVIT